MDIKGILDLENRDLTDSVHQSTYKIDLSDGTVKQQGRGTF